MLDSVLLFLRSLLFAALIPGTVIVLIPQWILGRTGRIANDTLLQAAGLVSILVGGSVVLWCIWDFARHGRGTLAPVDPPKHLVVHGLYHYVRNPMYLGALLALAGQAAFFGSVVLVWYSLMWFIWVHLFVVFYEEPTLRRSFGASYSQYCLTVRRWVPFA